MKTIVLNASPRKNWNTAQLLKSAQKGAESVGAETEYIDLYDLSFTGCRSCLACKRKGARRCHCFWKDDLSPVLDRVFSADALLIGSPVYLSDTTSQFHVTGKVNAGVVFTMNAPMELYRRYYERKLAEQAEQFHTLNGRVMVLPSCDTLQVKDYSKFDMAGFDAAHKKDAHERQFPVDLERAFQMGAELSRA